MNVNNEKYALWHDNIILNIREHSSEESLFYELTRTEANN